MIEISEMHNLFKKSLDGFKRFDPQLSRLEKLTFVHTPSLLHEIPVHTPGIYIVTGGRQVGKSTLLKMMILNLLQKDQVDPAQIYYLPCDTLEQFPQLLQAIED